MSREIKFRQWAGDRFYFWGIGLEDSTFTTPVSGGGINALNTIHHQYTGIKDCKGTEIWEGDIMAHPDFEDGAALIVGYDNGYFHLNGWDCVRTELSKGEVIGNIYEHPALLNLPNPS